MATVDPANSTAIGASAKLNFPDPGRLVVHYDRQRDILSASIEPPVPAISHDLDGEIWLRIVRETGEIVGFEIEDFVTHFLPAHPEFAAAWGSHPRRWFLPRTQPNPERLLEVIIPWLRAHAAVEPQQGSRLLRRRAP
ncbi:MAG: hypothetical protein ACYDCQ_08045 [Dehalococcoidia bacterium]